MIAAAEKRSAADQNGGASSSPIFIASHVEPQIRHSIAKTRFVMDGNKEKLRRKANGLLKAGISVYFWHHNFARIHGALRVTPAMEAGIVPTALDWVAVIG